MPFKTAQARREYQKSYKRMKAQERRQEKAVEQAKALDCVLPENPAQTLANWSKDRLVVPPGHVNAGEPLVLPDFGVSFIRDALEAKESLLCVARKNAKSAIVAVLLLGFLVGPLKSRGWRGGVASISKEKAGELKAQMQAISEAAGLPGLRFYRSPAPGRVETATGMVDLLAADTGAHASGLDLAVFDEIGLVPESQREFVASLRSSTSAKAGRFLALSIHGHGPFIPEMLARRDDDGVCIHLYQPAASAALDDEAAWYAGNPGLGTIKSLEHMRHESKRVLATPGDQAFFKAHEMNLPQDPAKQMIVTSAEWAACCGGDVPERRGGVCIGFDLGGAAAMCSLVAYWPDTSRLECFGAWPDTPGLEARGKADGVGSLYSQWYDSGEVWLYPGRVTNVQNFLKDCAAQLKGERVIMAGADRYRKAEALQALEGAGLNWPITWRGTGASKTADGSFDVRAFQKLTLTKRLRPIRGASILTQAIAGAAVRFDPAGNPALDKQKTLARIDPLQAAVIAAGFGLVEVEKKPARPLRYALV